MLPNSGNTFSNTLAVGPVVSELGRLGVSTGKVFSSGEWNLIPQAQVSLWHEFAGDIPSEFNSNINGGYAGAIT